MNLTKYIPVLLLFSLLLTSLHSQTIHFDYDNSGNRYRRELLIGGGGQKSMTIYNENTKALNENVKLDLKKEETIGVTSITIYPNPNQGQMVVQVDNLPLDVESLIKIFDLTGKLIFEKRNLETYTNVDITNSPNGTYIMTTSIDKKISEWKVIKK